MATTKEAQWSPERWRRLAKQFTAGATSAQLDAIVARLVANPSEGVWHAAAQVSGKPCWCFTCAPKGA